VNEIGLKGESDAEIYEYSKEKKYALITFDHEFGLEYISRKDLDCLIIIRIHPQTREIVHPALEKFFSRVKTGEIQISGHLVTIERNRIRLRKVI